MKQYAFVKWAVKLLGESRYINGCAIAHVKRVSGYAMRTAAKKTVANPCPSWAWNLIAIALFLYELRGKR